MCYSRSVRNVLRVRDIGGVRAGAERDPTGPRLLLPHAAAERRHLAHRGHAVDPALRVPLPAPYPGHQLPALHPHEGLAHHGRGRLHGLRVLLGLDSAVPGCDADYIEVQEKLIRHFRLFGVVCCSLFLFGFYKLARVALEVSLGHCR